jgi:hypothetical protein
MLEGMLLLLLALGGAGREPAAAVPSAASAGLGGVWRGTWTAAETPVPVEAIVLPAGKDGQLTAVLVTGTGRARRLARASGTLDADGARLMLAGGGTVRLAAASASRLVGIARGVGSGLGPGDGTLELSRVRR